MNDKNPLDVKWLSGLATGVALGILLSVAFAPMFSLEGYCNNGESNGGCIREYFSVAGSWLTVLGSSIAAYFIYQQFKEMRRQSSHILGNELPTFELTSNYGTLAVIACSVTNWNKHGFIIYEVYCSVGDENWEVADIGGEIMVHDGKLEMPITVHGTTSFEGEPRLRTTTLHMEGGAAIVPEGILNELLTVTFVGYLSADRNKRISIKASRPVRELVHPRFLKTDNGR